MPPTDYTYFITENLFISVHDVVPGKITNFVVKLHGTINEKAYELIRFDTAHGAIHKDILRPDGTKERTIFYQYLTNDIGINFAIDELEEHCEFYLERFTQWLNKKTNK